MQEHCTNESKTDKGFCCTLKSGKELNKEVHRHSDMEIVYVLDGSVEACIDEKTYCLTEGDLFFAPYYGKRGFFVEESCECYKLDISADHFRTLFSLLSEWSFPTNLIKPNEHTIHIEWCFQKLLAAEKHQGNEEYLSEGYLYVILGHLLEMVPLVPASQKRVPEESILERAMEFISANYLRDFTMSEMAKSIHCSTSSVSAAINQTFHCGFREYLNSFRVKCAKKLLSKPGSANILQVSIDSGFSSLRTFNRVFKQHTGVSPAEYKKQLKAANQLAGSECFDEDDGENSSVEGDE